MNTSEIMSAMIFGDGGASKVEELSTDGGSTDAVNNSPCGISATITLRFT